MPDFDAILKKSLASVNDAFQLANRDFEEMIDAISQAVQKTTKRNFALITTNLLDDVRGRVYRVSFDSDPDDSDVPLVSIAAYQIPSKGYPVLLGTFRKSADHFDPIKAFRNREDLEAHFAEMLDSPDSTLLQAIGFGMRNRSSDN